jgi:hypothetical protein
MQDSECLNTDDNLAPFACVFTNEVILISTGILNESYVAKLKFNFIL